VSRIAQRIVINAPIRGGIDRMALFQWTAPSSPMPRDARRPRPVRGDLLWRLWRWAVHSPYGSFRSQSTCHR
jgi:hypothetical protein